MKAALWISILLVSLSSKAEISKDFSSVFNEHDKFYCVEPQFANPLRGTQLFVRLKDNNLDATIMQGQSCGDGGICTPYDSISFSKVLDDPADTMTFAAANVLEYDKSMFSLTVNRVDYETAFPFEGTLFLAAPSFGHQELKMNCQFK